MSFPFIAFLFLSSPAHADGLTLAPVVAQGSPTEALQLDPVLPTFGAPLDQAAATGSVTEQIADETALPTSQTLRPGNTAQFRGLGLNADDTNVQAFGVPINPPQGGGLNLATLPHYLWESFRFQSGPAPGSFDPKSVAGSLILTPWTQSAMREEAGPATRVTQFYSGAGLFEMSLGTRVPGSGAVLLGYSEGKLEGPAGSLSVGRRLGADLSARFHLLMARTRAETPFGTQNPEARTLSARAIPVLATDLNVGRDSVLKSQLFFDQNYLRYENASFHSADHSSQLGFDHALLVGNTRLGASFRSQSLRTLDDAPPSDYFVNLQGSHLLELGSWSLEPGLQMVGAKDQGWSPEGSVGARVAVAHEQSLFGRVAFSRRFGSLTDRYYRVPGVLPNPDLKAERDWTAIIGTEGQAGALAHQLQLVGQLRQEAQQTVILPGFTYVRENRGQARIAALLAELSYSLTPLLRLRDNGVLTRSSVDDQQSRFPYVPEASNSLRIELGPGSALPPWLAFLRVRAVSRSAVEPVDLPGYSFYDLGGVVRFWGNFQLQATLENLGNRPIEISPGFPSEGRVGTLQLTGLY